MWEVEMVIPRFRSSGALSMAPYSRKLARDFAACLLVIAADRVVCTGQVSLSNRSRLAKVGLLEADLSVVDVTNCAWCTASAHIQASMTVRQQHTDVDVRLGALKDGVAAGKVKHGCPGFALQ